MLIAIGEFMKPDKVVLLPWDALQERNAPPIPLGLDVHDTIGQIPPNRLRLYFKGYKADVRDKSLGKAVYLEMRIQVHKTTQEELKMEIHDLQETYQNGPAVWQAPLQNATRSETRMWIYQTLYTTDSGRQLGAAAQRANAELRRQGILGPKEPDIEIGTKNSFITGAPKVKGAKRSLQANVIITAQGESKRIASALVTAAERVGMTIFPTPLTPKTYSICAIQKK
jgi:hypothetical protein